MAQLTSALPRIGPLLLSLAAQFAGAAENPGPSSPETESAQNTSASWIDTSHAYASNQAQALTQWMDNFFGDPEYDLEQAESQLRLELINDWESKDGHEQKVRLRGKVQLPKISRRLDLVFSGEESDLADQGEQELDDSVGLQYILSETVRSRFDVTLGYSSGQLRPGIKFRMGGQLSEKSNYRFIERIQYENGEGVFSTTQIDLNRSLDRDRVLRWSNRALWGENSEGVEWRTRLSLRQRINPESEQPIALAYNAAISGVTRPDGFIKNYRMGLSWRRQIYRDFLFLELEPAFNYRKKTVEDERDSVWSMTVRLEIDLHD